MKTVSGDENEVVSVLNADGKEIVSKEIPCSFTSVLISSPDMAVGGTVTLKIDDTETEIAVDNAKNGGMGGFGNKGGFNPDGGNGQSDFSGPGGQNPFGNKDGDHPPELPSGFGKDGAFSQRPDGNNQPPEMPDDSQKENRPEGQNGTPPEMPDGDNQGGMQMPDGKKDFRLQENEPFAQRDVEAADGQNEPFDATGWIWIGASAVVLIIGIIIALKKKA